MLNDVPKHGPVAASVRHLDTEYDERPLPGNDQLHIVDLGVVPKVVQTNEQARMVTGVKGSPWQWSKGQVVLLVEPAGNGSEITVQGQAAAQSLISLASPPAQKLVERAMDALRRA
jgi:hypothetical protein